MGHLSNCRSTLRRFGIAAGLVVGATTAILSTTVAFAEDFEPDEGGAVDDAP